ncbi:hypothetical protein R3P38DRAFT_1679143 [Favolaschia claudopus]|uniref:Uncharacterized protein n=1 Tax=Favolaschia claudopus TaxID=2862362 RepID=A0AAW0ACW4_9AGAR
MVLWLTLCPPAPSNTIVCLTFRNVPPAVSSTHRPASSMSARRPRHPLRVHEACATTTATETLRNTFWLLKLPERVRHAASLSVLHSSDLAAQTPAALIVHVRSRQHYVFDTSSQPTQLSSLDPRLLDGKLPCPSFFLRHPRRPRAAPASAPHGLFHSDAPRETHFCLLPAVLLFPVATPASSNSFKTTPPSAAYITTPSSSTAYFPKYSPARWAADGEPDRVLPSFVSLLGRPALPHHLVGSHAIFQLTALVEQPIVRQFRDLALDTPHVFHAVVVAFACVYLSRI